MNKSLVDRFWEKFERPKEGCWEWKGGLRSTGYGQVSRIKKSPIGSHRLSWMLFNGPIPEGLFVCHTCDNRKCVRPDHLFLGTASDNSKDCWNKGRGKTSGVYGIKQWCSKLTPNKAEKIRDLVLCFGMSQREVARIYGLNQRTVYSIVHGETWIDRL